MPVLKKDMKRAFRFNEAYTLLVALATAGAALLGGYKVFISEARAAGAEEAKQVSKRQDKVEANQDEVRLDMRALYQAVITRQPQERLEKPLPLVDGGTR